jgi:hypothetical protein
MEQFALWRRTLGTGAENAPQRESLRQAFLSFRARVTHLVNEIGALFPQLTVHDMTHLDALWRVADEIAGPDYPINPAEMFVLGGAFLLHDAAHVLAAYEEGIVGVRKTIEWKDFVAQKLEGKDPEPGSAAERYALFEILRHLHAQQARKLPFMTWKAPGVDEPLYLLEHFELRQHYGDLIGQIAESHHWSPQRVVAEFEHRYLDAPAFMAPASWSVDALKIAFLLRTADAAHIDAARAPWFLFALRRPGTISRQHWRFQAKLSQPKRTDRGELRISSGASFQKEEQSAWWLCHETARMIDRELRAAAALMRDSGRSPFATASVESVSDPVAFSTNVRTEDWEPIRAAPFIGEPAAVIAALGGQAIYGNSPSLALRELLQNAADAIRALRAMGGLDECEGRIDVELAPDGEGYWLHVTDSGIGMSRYVLTQILLDFGKSLWSSDALRAEIPGLAAKRFGPIGQFGIGFFSVFMLSQKVTVTTRRFRRASPDDSDQWVLEFDDGLSGSPTLRRPRVSEELHRAGTRVSLHLSASIANKLLATTPMRYWVTQWVENGVRRQQEDPVYSVAQIASILCPTIDIEVRVRSLDGTLEPVVIPGDWMRLSDAELLQRLYPRERLATLKLLDLHEPSGEVLGRVAYAPAGRGAVVSHRGLFSGKVAGIVGVVLGHNNTVLARQDSRPIASATAWELWADKWIDEFVNDGDFESLAALHSLTPERDLAVYRLDDELVNREQLFLALKSLQEIRLCEEFPDVEDIVEEHEEQLTHPRHFRLRRGVVFLPRRDSALAEALCMKLVDYKMRFERLLAGAWAEFEKHEEDTESVGRGGGIDDFYRPVHRYTRKRAGDR